MTQTADEIFALMEYDQFLKAMLAALALETSYADDPELDEDEQAEVPTTPGKT